MRSLKTGAVLLSIWSGLNLLVAVAVTGTTLAGHTPPALSLALTGAEIERVDAKILAVVNAQAAIANPCIAALCALVLVVTWTSLIAHARWAFWALAATLVPVQVFGFVSDAFLGHRNRVANVASSVLLAAGLALAARALLARRVGQA
jgi:hypothetical protein